VVFSGEPWQYSENAERLDHVFDFGAQIGGGVILWKKMIIDMRYSHSFITLKSPANGYENKIQLRGLQLSVAVPFKIG
jgi:hypothetical protein